MIENFKLLCSLLIFSKAFSPLAPFFLGSKLKYNRIWITVFFKSKLLLNIVKNNKIKIGKKVKIKFVKDRPGHDLRYALNSNKIKKQLKWKPLINFKSGLKETFIWYYENDKFFNNFSKKLFFKRLGLKKW